MKILLLGKGGQLGHALSHTLSPLGQLYAYDKAQADLTDLNTLAELLTSLRPQWIVNAAAYTAVEHAEEDRTTALAVNAVAPALLARYAAAHNAFFIHYSTDYVFDGSKQTPYCEDDAARPLNVYGASKLAGDEQILAVGQNAWVLRVAWLYSAHGRNFLQTVLRLAAQQPTLRIVADQIGCPTSVDQVALATAQLMQSTASRPSGFASKLYHLACQGQTSWHSYAQQIVQLGHAQGLRLKARPQDVLAICSAQYPQRARRPHFSALACQALQEDFGIALPPWQQALENTLAQMKGAA